MRTTNYKIFQIALCCLVLSLSVACTVQTTNTNTNANISAPPTASPSPTASRVTATRNAQLTLPLLDALLRDDAFVNQVKSKLQLTDEQVDQLKQAASAKLTQLRESNAEEQEGNATEAREIATQRIASIIGENKTNELANVASDFWARGAEEGDKGTGAEMPTTPNSVPTDTRVVVNIPGFRMDLFRDGSLVKSYKIGIGYPQFPLPQGLRKAQTIIFNPSWTPPDSPWVAQMKNVTPGEKIEPGSSLNPLGPIKIPIGLPSLIHGGKSPAKLGQFASHGCVGLTTTQVKDFAKLLAEASGTKLSDVNIANYLQDKTQTRAVKLGKTIPVELRYETIVIEDGKLHIYKDVYDQGTNTEDNLRRVLEANGMRLEDLSADERTQITDALNAMSAHPKQLSQPSPEESKNKKEKAKPPKKEKEVVLTLASLKSKGYPAPVNFDTGTGRPAAVAKR
jgi:murein L,D-transpeptidase YcbB/YkuD